jgi:hypothetical protein
MYFQMIGIIVEDHVHSMHNGISTLSLIVIPISIKIKSVIVNFIRKISFNIMAIIGANKSDT